MGASHEEGWCTTTNPRYLLKLSRIRPNGRKYLLLACAAVRHLVHGQQTEIANRILTAIERFAVAQPRKGVQTHIWREVVRQAIPEIPDPLPVAWDWEMGSGRWLREFERRLESLSRVSTSLVNVIFDIALPQVEYVLYHEVASEVRALTDRLSSICGPNSPPRLTVEQLREEIVSRVAPERRAAFRARWKGVRNAPAACRAASYLINERATQRTDELTARACDLVREVFGNPFHPPVIDPAWLQWNHGAVLHIAERIATSGDFADLPILGDALEDAGCCDEELLRHCRDPQLHVPGCWALDAVRGRN